MQLDNSSCMLTAKPTLSHYIGIARRNHIKTKPKKTPLLVMKSEL